jgi:hypothetical protein
MAQGEHHGPLLTPLLQSEPPSLQVKHRGSKVSLHVYGSRVSSMDTG